MRLTVCPRTDPGERTDDTQPLSSMESVMKKVTILLLVLGSFLAGCVAYEVEVPVASRGGYYYDRHGAPAGSYRDRDGDGVPNRYDRRPDDSRRY